MSEDFLLSFIREMLYQALLISAPFLITTLIAGLLVSVLQVMTQIQDNALSTIPKLLTAGITLFYAGAWMFHHLVTFAFQTIHHIPEALS